MKKERGFRRLTLVLSVIGAMLGIIVRIREIYDLVRYGFSFTTAYIVGRGLEYMLIGFASPWVLFLFIKYVVVAYIAKGFKSEDSSDN